MKKQRLMFMFFVVLLLLCCSVILSLSKEALAFTLPDTGQTKCYEYDTAGIEIACTGTGQDGAYSSNPMSYTDNGNGTITDNATGLMWQKGENATYYNWYKASGTYDATYNPSSQNVCGSLSLAGDGWRLPTKKELMSIVDYRTSSSATINTTYFPNTYAGEYWSSTTFAYTTHAAFLVNFSVGLVGGANKVSDGYVRCVRGGQSSPSFTNNGNGTVTDNETGLMWQQGYSGTMTWANALTYCEGLSLGGQTDWRLPNIKELESITDDTKDFPAIDTTYFPNTYAPQPDYYWWSSTTYAYGTGDAWYVDFGGGYAYYSYSKSYNYYVRCVRGGQSGSSTVNNCAASVSSGLVVHIPIVTYSGANYWADLQYNSSTGQLTVAGADKVSDISSYSSCTASTLSSDFKLHVPVVMLSGVSYWLDLQWSGSAFAITGGGAN